MNLNLIFKNSLRKMKSDFKILLILFLYIFFAFSIIFGIFGLTSQLHNKLITQSQRVGIRADGVINHENMQFFTAEATEGGVTYSIQYEKIVLDELNKISPDVKTLDLETDLDFLQTLDKYQGSVYNMEKAKLDNVESYQDLLDSWLLKTKKTIGNVYNYALSNILNSQQDVVTLNAYRYPAAQLNGQSSRVLVQDFSNHGMKFADYTREYDNEDGYMPIYMMTRDYKSFAGKKIAITFSQGENVLIKCKVVGYEYEYTNLMSWTKYNFLVDSSDFFDAISNANVSNTPEPLLEVEDTAHKGTTPNQDRLVPMLENLGDPSLAQSPNAERLKFNNSDTYNLVNYLETKNAVTLFRSGTVLVVVILIVLTFSIMFFVMRQLINADKRILYFLKTLGTPRWKLALVNVIDIFWPIIFALAVSVPMTFEIQHLLYQSIMGSYNLTVDMWDLTWITWMTMGITFVATFVIFFILVLINVSDKVLHPANIFNLSKTEQSLNHLKPFFKKVMRVNNGVAISFLIKNFFQNLVTFFIFAIAIGFTLFGQLFTYSANKSVDKAVHFFDPYTVRSSYQYQQPLVENGKPVYGYATSSETMRQNDDAFANNSPESKTDRRIQISLDGVPSINYYDTKNNGKLVPISLLYPDQVVDKLRKIDLNGRYLLKEDINNVLNSDLMTNPDFVSIQLGDTTLGQIFTSIKSRITEIKGYYPEYDGTDVSFGVNYATEGDDLANQSFNFYFTAKNNNLTSQTKLKLLSDDMKKFFPKSELLKTTEVKVVKKPKSFNEKTFISTDDLKVQNFVSLENFADKKLTSYKAPVVTIIAPGTSKLTLKETPGFSIPIATSESGKTIYLPLNYRVVKFDKVNKAQDYWVDPAAIKSYIDAVLPDYLAGLNYYNKNIGKTFSDFTSLSANGLLTAQTTDYYNNGMPRGYQELVLSSLGDPNIADNYHLTSSMIEGYPVDVQDFKLIGELSLQTLGPIISIIKDVSIFSFLIAVLVAILLVYLILKENMKIIMILKIMGYRKREITGYIIFGYVISTLLASLLAVGVSFIGFYFSTSFITKMFSIAFNSYISKWYIMILVLAPVAYLALIAFSINIISSKSNVHSIEQSE